MESAATTVFTVWLRAWFWCVFGDPLIANCWTEIYQLGKRRTASSFCIIISQAARLNEKKFGFLYNGLFFSKHFPPPVFNGCPWDTCRLEFTFTHKIQPFLCKTPEYRILQNSVTLFSRFFCLFVWPDSQTDGKFDLNRRFSALWTCLTFRNLASHI